MALGLYPTLAADLSDMDVDLDHILWSLIMGPGFDAAYREIRIVLELWAAERDRHMQW